MERSRPKGGVKQGNRPSGICPLDTKEEWGLSLPTEEMAPKTVDRLLSKLFFVRCHYHCGREGREASLNKCRASWDRGGWDLNKGEAFN